MVWAALLLITLAVSRITRLITTDALLLPFRRWIVKRWGEDSPLAYLVHCSWCTSVWISIPAGIAWAFLLLPLPYWWLAAPAALTMSYLTGLLSQVEER